MKILRAASLGSNFTGSYKKKRVRCQQCFDSLSYIQKFITFCLLSLLLHNRAIA